MCMSRRNDRPKMSEDSYAVWRRVRVIDWPVRFTERPQEGNAMEGLLDPLLDEKARRWPPYFAGMMVRVDKNYTSYKLTFQSEKVLRASDLAQQRRIRKGTSALQQVCPSRTHESRVLWSRPE